MNNEVTHHLLITYPFTADNTLVVVTGFFQQQGFHILTIEQQISPEEPVAFMRVDLQSAFPVLSDEPIRQGFQEQVAERYQMSWSLHRIDQPKNMAILVSRHDHVLLDLLKRKKRQQFNANILCVISNHPDLRHEVEDIAELPFHELSAAGRAKEDIESEMLSLLGNKPDLIVLARYMQVLSADFVSHYQNKILNIHHSFLPAFAGANPYQQAYQRGVKLIGATAHYVTNDLDQGPIIEQETIRVSHRYSTENLKEVGSDLECNVLAKAVRWHLDDRIIVHGNKTTIFYS